MRELKSGLTSNFVIYSAYHLSLKEPKSGRGLRYLALRLGGFSHILERHLHCPPMIGLSETLQISAANQYVLDDDNTNHAHVHCKGHTFWKNEPPREQVLDKHRKDARRTLKGTV